ncbi:type II CAAX prenyl endopeptidase Rce1 family protein [Neobacillus sp. NPDC093182]|uniref:CPBP family glutamic-type intramembrane protease n=1 Tax=Neobacillus sp. NPDC093182 TaxID=3364297 RepID=UPI00381C8F4E
MKNYLSMIGNYLLYLAVMIVVILIYNVLVNPFLGWGQFGTGENIAVQMFLVLAATIGLSAIVYMIKYRVLKQTPESFWGIFGFSKIRLGSFIYMVIIGLAFTLLNAAVMKWLLLHNITSLNDFTESYYNSVSFTTLIFSSVITTALELIVFIGIMFNEAKKNVHIFWPILGIALIIAVIQAPGGIWMQLLGVALGLVYGYIYVRSSSIWSVISIGIAFNVSLFSMKKIGWLDSMENMSEISLIILGVAMAAFILISTVWYWRKPK